MPKLKPDTITEADLSAFLHESDDFQFEMDVFQMCRRHQFTASHGGIYHDPNLKKDRQYDVRAEIRNYRCVVKLAVECKNLRANFPLVVSRVPRLLGESTHQVVKAQECIAQVEEYSLGRSVFRSGDMVGKSTAQVGRAQSTNEWITGDAETYEKWSQALASSYDLVVESASEWSRTGYMPTFIFVQPVLVVADNTLWAANYSTQGELAGKPNLVDECTLYLDKLVLTFSSTLAPYKISHLLIFTKRGFENYLEGFGPSGDYWYSIFLDNLRLP